MIVVDVFVTICTYVVVCKLLGVLLNAYLRSKCTKLIITGSVPFAHIPLCLALNRAIDEVGYKWQVQIFVTSDGVFVPFTTTDLTESQLHSIFEYLDEIASPETFSYISQYELNLDFESDDEDEDDIDD